MWWLVACGEGGPEARFEETRRACDWTAGSLDGALAFGEPRYPSEDCVDRVLLDFSVDLWSLLQVDWLDDPYGVVRGEPVLHTRLGTLLAGVRLLGLVELGEVDALPGAGWAGGGFARTLVETAEVTGQRRVGGALYDWAASRIGQTGYGPTGTADAALSRGGELSWDLADCRSFDALGLLAHEARHADGAQHVPCGDGRGRICDATAHGAVGFQIGVHALLVEATSDEEVRVALEASMASLVTKVR